MNRDKKPYRILIIEDNEGDFIIVEDLLTEQISGPVIVHAVNYKEAAAILSSDRGFSVVLLDLSLPDKSGRELVEEMLKLTLNCCPVIILTGYTDIGFSIKSIGQGIFDYLLKDDLTATSLYKSIIYAIERMKSGLQISASEKRYSDLFNLSPQPMWVFDAETFRFVQVNQATVDLYGYSEEEFLNMSLMDIKQKDDIHKATESLGKPNPVREIFKQTLLHHKKSGEIIEMEIYSTPIVINDKNFCSVIAIDVTEKNLHEHRITKAIIKTQEDERYEIGGELHDNVCQILAASQMSLGMAKHNIAAGDIPAFDQGREYIMLALDEIRNLSHRLAPAFFDNVSLKEAFQRLFKTFDPARAYKIVLHLEEEIAEYHINRDIQLNIYRVLQEQLRNIFKYAHATVITVDVYVSNDRLKMKVSDNGVGFNVDTHSTGIGFANMKRRAELFSGKMEIDSFPGKGCSISIEIPLPEPEFIHSSL